VYDKFTGQTRGTGIIPWLHTAVYLELTPGINIMYNSMNEYEYAVVQVTFAYGSGKIGISTTEYKIINLFYSYASSSNSSSSRSSSSSSSSSSKSSSSSSSSSKAFI